MTPLILSLLFAQATVDFNLPPDVLSSICYVESTHRVDAIHYNDGAGNSVGICQVKLSTAKWLGFTGTEEQLKDPRYNIHYAAKYFRYQLNRYNDSVLKAVLAYNKGNAKGQLTNLDYYHKVYKHYINNGDNNSDRTKSDWR